MTFHLFSEDTYQCGSCAAFFIPFARGLPCPRCGVPASVFHDFIPEAADGLTSHKREYGRYEPAAFFVGGLPEHVFLLLCQVFDAAEGSEDFRSTAERYLSSSDWGDQAYMGTHILEIAVGVKERMGEI